MTDNEFRPMTAAEYNASQAADMTEARLQAVIIAAAQRAGWMVYHTHDSRRSEPGYPDLHLVHERRHLSMMRELKTQKGVLSAPQKRWLLALTEAGIDADVWRPADWFSGHITQQLTN